MAFTVPSMEFSMGTKARSANPRLDGVEDLGQSPDRKHGSRCIVGLGEQRLLGEGARRPQEGDRADLRSGTPAAL